MKKKKKNKYLNQAREFIGGGCKALYAMNKQFDKYNQVDIYLKFMKTITAEMSATSDIE